jgi:aspartyl-tRNA(Asn)/glutamyl-tRNA(Gln) amidotransferase subunit A
VNADRLCDLDLKSVSEAIQGREVSSVEATEAYLQRIERYDSVLRSYLTVTAEPALEQARAADAELARGHSRGPLHGVPLGLKDLIAWRGVRMTGGSRLLADYVPTESSPVVEQLLGAGAVLLGKQAMSEFAFGFVVEDGPLATGRNPWDVTRIPYGSSSGSAVAVAAGLCAGAVGSDTGGSIRGPAAHCGLVGHKPTYGLVTRRGMLPMCWSLDHIGPITRSVWDSAVLLQAIAGRDPLDASTRAQDPPDLLVDLEGGVRGLRLGLLRRFYVDWDGLSEDMRGPALAAIEELARQGAAVEDADLPTLDLAFAIWHAFLTEMYAYHAETLRAQPERYSDGLRARLALGALYTAEDLWRAQRLRARFAREAAEALRRFDALVFPGFPTPAARLADAASLEMPQSKRYHFPWNLLGLPAAVVPCGFSPEGLPVSLQIVGRPFEDATVLRIARAYERATDWHIRRPDPDGWRLPVPVGREAGASMPAGRVS